MITSVEPRPAWNTHHFAKSETYIYTLKKKRFRVCPRLRMVFDILSAFQNNVAGVAAPCQLIQNENHISANFRHFS